jgi:HK97 family phage major capsid protein
MKPEEKVAEASAALDAKRAETKSAWKAFEDVKVKALADPDVADQESEAFKALDAAGKAYDGLCDETNAMQASFQRLSELLLGKQEPADRQGTVADLQPGKAVSGIADQRAPLVDVSAFMDSLREWRGKVGDATIGDPRQHFGSSPGIKLIDRARVGEIMNTVVLTTAYPSVPFRRPGIVPALLENLDVLDLITFVPTDAEVIQYVNEDPFTNAAVETAEAQAAPEGEESFSLNSVSCKWIPFTIPQTRQILSDEPRLQAWIQNRIVWGVRDRLQNQIINGNGVGENLLGLTQWPNILDQPKPDLDVGDERIDAVHMAKTAIIVATKGMYTPQILMLHPDDLEEIELAKDTIGRYYFGGPGQDGVGTIWGMRPVAHPLFETGCPIIGDLGGCEAYIREDVSLSVTDSHADHFTRGIIDFLASGRFAFAVLQPKAFCTIAQWND